MKNKIKMLALTKWIIFALIFVAVIFASVFTFRWFQGNSKFESLYALASGIAIPVLMFALSIIKEQENSLNKASPTIIIQNPITQMRGNTSEKEELVVQIEKASVKYLDESGHYRIHIDVRLGAKNKNICLKSIRLKAFEMGEISSSDSAFGKYGETIRIFSPRIEQDLLALNDNSFYKYKKDMDSQGIAVRDFVIQEGTYFSATVAGDFYSERWPDGWEDLPLKNWRLIIEHDDKEQTVNEFSFTVHHTNSTRVVKTEYIGFK